MSEDYYHPIIGHTPSGEESAGVFGQPAYDGADSWSRELASWQPPFQSVDSDIIPEKEILDVRTRDAMRNDAYVQNSRVILQDAIVGEMFLLNSKPNTLVLGLDEVWAEEFQEEVESKFTLYAESERNFADASRQNTLTGLVRLAVGIHTMGGEVLASAEWLRNQPRPFNTAMQLIDTDRLSNPNGEMSTRYLRGGVKRGQWGEPLGYWIRNDHPTDLGAFENYFWQYVPATRGMATGRPSWDRSQMLHIIDQTRPDQTRAVARIVAALKETKMAKRFRDTVLQNAVLNAMYAASIESDLPQDVAMVAAGGQGAESKRAIPNYANQFLAEVAQFTKGKRDIMGTGVRVPVFYPGTRMKLQSASTPGGIGTEFESSLLRYLAAATNTTYEQLSKDYSSANYSNLRAAMADAERSNRVTKRRVADRTANWFFRLWLEEALNKGEITSMPRNAPNWYDGLNSDAYCQAEWIGASMGQIDELKETQAALLRLNNGLSTFEQEHARLGRDWRKVLPQLAREQKIIKELGLELGADKSSQNTANATNGQPAEGGNSPRSADSEEKTDE